MIKVISTYRNSEPHIYEFPTREEAEKFIEEEYDRNYQYIKPSPRVKRPWTLFRDEDGFTLLDGSCELVHNMKMEK